MTDDQHQPEPGERENPTSASCMTAGEMALRPRARHAIASHGFVAGGVAGAVSDTVDASQLAHGLAALTGEVEGGNLTISSQVLIAQALTLDSVFTDLTRKAGNCLYSHPDAGERLLRLALKAQAASRATLAELAKLHQPREQTVRHVHVSEGGQAVIADQFHHYAGGRENGQSAGQPQATGAGAAGAGPSLPCPDPFGPAVPVPCGTRQSAMQDARRQGKRRAAR
ncbi:MAG: hypothetical protein KGZ65_12930 [Sphingomonadales bacterium]|nr:hypothetical protein [Sphingomonadaceae bacterium]MBS3932131.1 hypothetical protein [Sphingomonadales bacterium]